MPGGHLDAGRTLSGDQALIQVVLALCLMMSTADGDLPQRTSVSCCPPSREENPVGRSWPRWHPPSRRFQYDHDPRFPTSFGLRQTMQGLDGHTDIYSAKESDHGPKYIKRRLHEINNVDEWKKMMTMLTRAFRPPTRRTSTRVEHRAGNHRAAARLDSSANEDGTQKKAKRTGSVAVAQRNGITGAAPRRPSASRNWAILRSFGNADSPDYPKTGDFTIMRREGPRAQEIVDAFWR